MALIFAVMLVRNEADILRTNLLYHLASGIDQVLAVDNGSTDGTMAILEEFAATGRVHVVSRPGPFHQAAITTAFAREAFLRGAEWVLPIDADEFWYAPGARLRDVLDNSEGAGALQVAVVNFVQDRAQEELSAAALLTMTRRVPEPIGTSGEAAELVESGRISFVECRYPPKYVSRGSIVLDIAQGNHDVSGTDGPIKNTEAIVCLHAPLRARAALVDRKVEQGRRVEDVNHYLKQAWHVRRWRRLAEQGGLDAEWAANSYLDGCLDVAGTRHPLTFDTTLRNVVEPWVQSSAARLVTVPRSLPARATTMATLAPLDSASVTAIIDRAAHVDGWLRADEAALLIDVTRRAVMQPGPSAVVEVGSFCGKSTVVLASAARSANACARVYAIDPHEGQVSADDPADGTRTGPPTFERFQQNISAAGVGDMIEPIRRRSHEVAWRSPIAFLFVDGFHDYWSVARDFCHFEPYVPDGAFVAFHNCDERHPGVKAFVVGLAGCGCYQEVNRAASLVVFCKTATAETDAKGEHDRQWITTHMRLTRQERGLSFLIGELASRNRTIQEREEGIEWLRGVVRDKEATIAELEKGVAWLRAEIRERDELIRARRPQASPADDSATRAGTSPRHDDSPS